MSALLGSLWPYLAGAAALLIGVWRVWASGKKSGVDAQKAKEAAATAKDIENIKKAAEAGTRVRADDDLMDDPYNRDRRGKPK